MWFGRAVEQGCASAQYDLGVCYYNGQGVEQDRDNAVKLWNMAAEQGYEEAVDALRELIKK